MNATSECLPYVVHLRDEHRRLHQATKEIESALSKRGEPLEGKQVAGRLRDLRDELQRHFQQEEQGGCIEEAVVRCPSLSAQSMDLEREHSELSRELDELIARAERNISPATLAADYKRFAKRLHAHEAQETRLLQEGFNVHLE